jgi:hypothetical protein
MGGNITELKTPVQNTGNFFYKIANLSLTATLFGEKYLPDDCPNLLPHRYQFYDY